MSFTNDELRGMADPLKPRLDVAESKANPTSAVRGIFQQNLDFSDAQLIDFIEIGLLQLAKTACGEDQVSCLCLS